MADQPLSPATRRRLGRPLPHQQADRPRAHPTPKKLSTTHTKVRSYPVLDPVSQAYPRVQGRSPTCYSPVRHSSTSEKAFPFDLHVLSTPPAFVLSQDQTLHKKSEKESDNLVKKLQKKNQRATLTQKRLIKCRNKKDPHPTNQVSIKNNKYIDTLLSSHTTPPPHYSSTLINEHPSVKQPDRLYTLNHLNTNQNTVSLITTPRTRLPHKQPAQLTNNNHQPHSQQPPKASIDPIKLLPSPPDKQKTQPPEPISCEVIFSVSPSRRPG